MAKYIFRSLILGGLLIICSCSTDLSDVESRLDELESRHIEEPKLLSFELLADDNPMQLTSNVKGEIIGDSVVDCWIPNITSDKLLIPQAEFVGESIMFDELPVTIMAKKQRTIPFVYIPSQGCQ